MSQRFMNDILKGIRLFFFDVDGVFTDGTILYSDSGCEIKSFNTLDGLGVLLLQEIGIKPIIITARRSEIVLKRFDELGLPQADIYQGVIDKREFVRAYLSKNFYSRDVAAFMGDDLTDLRAFSEVGFTAAPLSAAGLVKENAMYVTTSIGGQGAVREVCELIIASRLLSPLEVFDNYVANKEL